MNHDTSHMGPTNARREAAIPNTGDGGSQLDAYVTSGESPPSAYYMTTDRAEATWLLDTCGLPLKGKLTVRCRSPEDPQASRHLCDKLGVWQFQRSQRLNDLLTAWKAGPAAQRRLLAHFQAEDDQKREEAWREQQKASELRARRAVVYQIANGLLSLDRPVTTCLGQAPRTLLDQLEGAEADAYNTTGRGVVRKKELLGSQLPIVTPVDPDAYDMSCVNVLDLGAAYQVGVQQVHVAVDRRRPGTFISPHPCYRAALDSLPVARDAVRWLYEHDYWGLLECVGIGPKDAFALDVLWGGPLLTDAAKLRKQAEKLVEQAAWQLLTLYHRRTGHNDTTQFAAAA